MENIMKAVICTKYGPPEVLKMHEIEKPTPKENEVLIKILATTVSAADYRIRGFNIPTGFGLLMRLVIGFNKPRKAILGMSLAGDIEKIGSKVSQFKPNDSVYASTSNDLGAYAEYICRHEDTVIVKKSNTLSYNQAAAIPFGALTALTYLQDKGKINKGQNILIYGASGAVGTAAVQLAKYFNTTITAVCSSTNIEMVKSLGADKVIDYTTEDFMDTTESFDIIMDTVGKCSYLKCKKLLKPNGRFLFVFGGLPQILLVLWTSLFSNKKVLGGDTSSTKDKLQFINDLIEHGQFRSVIDRTYPLEQIVEAHRYADLGHKKGNVVITVA